MVVSPSRTVRSPVTEQFCFFSEHSPVSVGQHRPDGEQPLQGVIGDCGGVRQNGSVRVRRAAFCAACGRDCRISRGKHGVFWTCIVHSHKKPRGS